MADEDNTMSRSEAARRAGRSQGKENNPENFANKPKKASKAGEVGGSHSHGGGRPSENR